MRTAPTIAVHGSPLEKFRRVALAAPCNFLLASTRNDPGARTIPGFTPLRFVVVVRTPAAGRAALADRGPARNLLAAIGAATVTTSTTIRVMPICAAAILRRRTTLQRQFWRLLRQVAVPLEQVRRLAGVTRGHDRHRMPFLLGLLRGLPAHARLAPRRRALNGGISIWHRCPLQAHKAVREQLQEQKCYARAPAGG